jgi:hypothetical protein
MTSRTPQCEVFCPLLLSSKHSGVPEDSQPPTFPSVGLHPHTWPKWGCDTRATWTHETYHDPDLGEAITFPFIVYSMAGHGAYIQMAFLSQDSRMGVPKSRQLCLSQLWNPITLRVDLRLRCGLKQSCSSHWELFNGMSHAFHSQVIWVDSWFFPVSLTPDPSFDHNLCFRCPNE